MENKSYCKLKFIFLLFICGHKLIDNQLFILFSFHLLSCASYYSTKTINLVKFVVDILVADKIDPKTVVVHFKDKNRVKQHDDSYKPATARNLPRTMEDKTFVKVDNIQDGMAYYRTVIDTLVAYTFVTSTNHKDLVRLQQGFILPSEQPKWILDLMLLFHIYFTFDAADSAKSCLNSAWQLIRVGDLCKI